MKKVAFACGRVETIQPMYGRAVAIGGERGGRTEIGAGGRITRTLFIFELALRHSTNCRTGFATIRVQSHRTYRTCWPREPCRRAKVADIVGKFDAQLTAASAFPLPRRSFRFFARSNRRYVLARVLQNHRSLFVDARKPFSLLDVVVDETKIRLADRNCGDETRAACNRLLSELVELNVGYARNRPRHLRQQLLKQTFAPARAGGVVATGSRASRNRAARPSTSSSNTAAAAVSLWRRREQRAAADGTLRRIDELTNAWKTESRRRASVEAEDETTTCRTEGRRVDEAELSSSSSSSSDRDDPAADSCVGRLGRVRYAAGQPPPGDSQRPAPRSPPTLDALTISAGDERDSDFEKSVHAYRLAKRAARSLASSEDAIGPATVSANRNGAAGSDGAARRGRPESNGKTVGDDAFGNYLARSTAGLARKFRPGQIEF